jgi:hypothetical protein
MVVKIYSYMINGKILATDKGVADYFAFLFWASDQLKWRCFLAILYNSSLQKFVDIIETVDFC